MIVYLKKAWDVAVADFVLKSIIALSLLAIFVAGYAVWYLVAKRK